MGVVGEVQPPFLVVHKECVMAEVKRILKIAQLAQLKHMVDISDTEVIEVRPLSLIEMVKLFLDSKDAFLPLFAAGVEGKLRTEDLLPFLMSTPEIVARIIAFASDEPDQVEAVQKCMPATVQLIALREIWKASVPEPKKAQELLSEVMALLSKLKEKGEQLSEDPKMTSLTTVLDPSTSL